MHPDVPDVRFFSVTYYGRIRASDWTDTSWKHSYLVIFIFISVTATVIKLHPCNFVQERAKVRYFSGTRYISFIRLCTICFTSLSLTPFSVTNLVIKKVRQKAGVTKIVANQNVSIKTPLYFSVQLMLIGAVVNWKCMVVIGNCAVIIIAFCAVLRALNIYRNLQILCTAQPLHQCKIPQEERRKCTLSIKMSPALDLSGGSAQICADPPERLYIRWHWRHSVNGGYRRHAGCILYIAAM